nr:hypothetical protein CFP56_67629 [Quercus suber]
MAARKAAKLILEQPSDQPKAQDEQRAKEERDRNNLKIALYHAYKIQDQKNVQVEILNRLESLIDLPSSASFTPQDAKYFTSAVHIFQPSDLDDLVEERRIEGRCGYVLCSNTPRGNIVPTWKVGKGSANYCTDVCMTRMFYVKTQLSEVPAWEREADQQPEIALHHEDQRKAELIQKLEEPRPKPSSADDVELAFERGETKASFRPRQVMTDKIVEKAVIGHALSERFGQSSYRAIEGYEPKHKAKKDQNEFVKLRE